MRRYEEEQPKDVTQITQDDADSPVIEQLHLLLERHLLPRIQLTSVRHPRLQHLFLLVLIGLEHVFGGRMIIRLVNNLRLWLDNSLGVDLLHDGADSLVVIGVILLLGLFLLPKLLLELISNPLLD